MFKSERHKKLKVFEIFVSHMLKKHTHHAKTIITFIAFSSRVLDPTISHMEATIFETIQRTPETRSEDSMFFFAKFPVCVLRTAVCERFTEFAKSWPVRMGGTLKIQLGSQTFLGVLVCRGPLNVHGGLPWRGPLTYVQ